MKYGNILVTQHPYVFSLLVVFFAGVVSFILDAWFLPTQGTLLILQLAVLTTAMSGNKPSALFAGILSGITFNYFFTSPRLSLHMSNVDDIVNLLIFLIVAIVTSYLTAFYKTQQEALEQAKLRASILMSVSHDLRTPLSTIIGTLSTMQAYDDRLPKSEKAELLQGAIEESHRLHRYIENLLQATKLQQGIKLNGTRQDISPIIERVVERFNTTRIKIIRDSEAVEVYTSIYLLEQAIYNVIDNALKYSPQDTLVTIKFGAVADSLLIDVFDEGPGINLQHRNKVFDLFFSTRIGDAGHGGTGVGLTVAKGIIDAHKGSISIMPSTKGCAVQISLPVYDGM